MHSSDTAVPSHSWAQLVCLHWPRDRSRSRREHGSKSRPGELRMRVTMSSATLRGPFAPHGASIMHQIRGAYVPHTIVKQARTLARVTVPMSARARAGAVIAGPRTRRARALARARARGRACPLARTCVLMRASVCSRARGLAKSLAQCPRGARVASAGVRLRERVCASARPRAPRAARRVGTRARSPHRPLRSIRPRQT